MKLTNGTNMPNLRMERTETNEIHQQKNITKPTNGTNMSNRQAEQTERNETYQQKKHEAYERNYDAKLTNKTN